jgi:hypothetical protein
MEQALDLFQSVRPETRWQANVQAALCLPGNLFDNHDMTPNFVSPVN